jgi:hypothetical protein
MKQKVEALKQNVEALTRGALKRLTGVRFTLHALTL